MTGIRPKDAPDLSALKGEQIPVPPTDKPNDTHGDRKVEFIVPLGKGAVDPKYKESAAGQATAEQAMKMKEGFRPDGTVPIETLRATIDRARADLGPAVSAQIAGIVEYTTYQGGCRVNDDVPRMSVLARLITSSHFKALNELDRQAALRSFISNRDDYERLKNLPESAKILAGPAFNPPKMTPQVRGACETYLIATLGDRAKMAKLEELVKSPGFTEARQAALVLDLFSRRDLPVAELDRTKAVADVLANKTLSTLASKTMQGVAWQLLNDAWRDRALFDEVKAYVTTQAFATDTTARDAKAAALRERIEALPPPPKDAGMAEREAVAKQIAPALAELDEPSRRLGHWLLSRASGDKAVLDAFLALTQQPSFASEPPYDRMQSMIALLDRVTPKKSTDAAWHYDALGQHETFKTLPEHYRLRAYALLSRCEGAGRMDQFDEIRRGLTSARVAKMDVIELDVQITQYERIARELAAAECKAKAPLLKTHASDLN